MFSYYAPMKTRVDINPTKDIQEISRECRLLAFSKMFYNYYGKGHDIVYGFVSDFTTMKEWVATNRSKSAFYKDEFCA